MPEYKPNSHKYHEERSSEDAAKETKAPVVRGNVKVKKESVGRKFADTFLAETVQNTGKYMVNDVIIPAIVDTIVDALTSGISMLFKGSPVSSRRRDSSGKTNYTSFSRGNQSSNRDERRTYSRDRYGILDITYDSRGDALEVRDCLYEIFDKYKIVTVSDYYEISKAGDQVQYTDRKYGWLDLGDLPITRDRDGYRIKMPRVEPID